MRIASRNWTDRWAVFDSISYLVDRQHGDWWTDHDLTVLHGGAGGADSLAGQCAAQLLIPVLVERANWGRLGRAAGPERNRRMLALGPDLVLAFKDDAQRWDGLGPHARGGTEHMCRIALAAKVPVLRYSHEHAWEELSA